MKILTINWTLAALLAAAALSPAVITSPALAQAGVSQHASAIMATAKQNTAKPSTAMRKQAQQWFDELKVQPHLSGWADAKLSYTPLGPGTHSWLAIVSADGRQVGYMVINATPEGGYQLGEYGSGDYPLFSEQLLDYSITGLELPSQPQQIHQLYGHPLLAMWQITANNETHYTDAFTGELLPVDQAEWEAVIEEEQQLYFHGLTQSSAIQASSLLAAFDPYERLPWLTKDPLQFRNTDSLISIIKNQKPLRYAAERYHGQMLYAWAVVGYMQWDASPSSELYIALSGSINNNDVIRYIPYSLLHKLGSFYD